VKSISYVKFPIDSLLLSPEELCMSI